MLSIIQRTPPWVWCLSIALVTLGVVQSRDAVHGKNRVAIFPISMLLFSLYSVLSSFGTEIAMIIAFAVGVVLGIALGWLMRLPRGVRYDDNNQRFNIPGSWLPLLLMMAIFWIKYAVGVALSINPQLREVMELVLSCSIVYGIFGGLFFSRWLVIRSSANAENSVWL